MLTAAPGSQGGWYPEPFQSREELVGFMASEAAPEVWLVCGPLWDASIRPFETICNWRRLDESALQWVLNPDNDDKQGISRLTLFSGHHAGKHAQRRRPFMPVASYAASRADRPGCHANFIRSPSCRSNGSLILLDVWCSHAQLAKPAGADVWLRCPGCRSAKSRWQCPRPVAHGASTEERAPLGNMRGRVPGPHHAHPASQAVKNRMASNRPIRTPSTSSAS